MFSNPPVIKLKGSLITCSDGSSLLAEKRKPGKRGVIKGMSKASQKRLYRKLAQIEKPGCLFVTITSKEHVKFNDIRALLKRIYEKYGKHTTIWKKEYQKRGTIHYHLLIFGRFWLAAEWLRESWKEITGVEYNPLVNVQFKQSGRVMAYISKYVMKSVLNLKEIGASPHGRAEYGEAPNSLNDNRDEKGILENSNISGESAGRFWGIENRKLIKYHKTIELKYEELTEKEKKSLNYLWELMYQNKWSGRKLTIVSWEREFIDLELIH